MNEKLLEAIIKLLVLIAKSDGITNEEYDVVRGFLADHASPDDMARHINFFEEKAKTLNGDVIEVNRICEEINLELTYKQKNILLVHLTRLVLADKHLTDLEEKSMRAFCASLFIPEEHYEVVKKFLRAENIDELIGNNVVVISDDKSPSGNTLHHYTKNLASPMAIIKLPFTDMYFLRVFSKNTPIYLNDDHISTDSIYSFTIGSVIKAEQISPIFYSDIQKYFRDSDPDNHISFIAENIEYKFPTGDMGLRGVTVKEESGNLIAIMGASGSGKSTLLNVLAGISRPQKGTVKLNGLDIFADKTALKGVIGFVPQDDLLIEDITVRQNLFFAAKLCFAKTDDETLGKMVDQTLERLGLYEVRNLRVGNPLDKTISGGQRKRLNIALELIREPQALFLDEPTSGLSSRDSENIIDLLRALTYQGKLVFLVIHQPSSDIFKMFDKLLILDTGGHQIYYGNPVESVVYFKSLTGYSKNEKGMCIACGNVNPEEVFNIIDARSLDEHGYPTQNRRISPQTWSGYFKANIEIPYVAHQTNKPKGHLNIAGYIRQFITFAHRDILAKFNNKQYMAINLMQAPLLALLLASTIRYFKTDEIAGHAAYSLSGNMNLPAYLFMSSIVALFMGLTMSAEEIIKDAKIKKREVFLNLSRGSYLFSKIVNLFGFAAFQSATYVLVGNYIMGINGLGFEYFLALFTTSCFAIMLGLNISDSFKSAITVYILIPILLIPQLLLGGVVVKFDDVNPLFANKSGKVPLVGDAMTSRWSFEALAVTQFKDNEFERNFYDYDKQISFANYRKNYYLPQLEGSLGYCKTALEQKTRTEKQQADYAEHLLLLKNEILAEQKLNPFIKFASTDLLTTEKFDGKVAQDLSAHLSNLKEFYIKYSKKYIELKNEKLSEILSQPDGESKLKQLTQHYHNQYLEDLVTNKANESRIERYDHKLIQRIDPVYLEPRHTSHLFDYRAHFFAPVKHFLGYYFPTYGFNLSVIWFMSALLFVSLYFSFLKRLLFFAEKATKFVNRKLKP